MLREYPARELVDRDEHLYRPRPPEVAIKELAFSEAMYRDTSSQMVYPTGKAKLSVVSKTAPTDARIRAPLSHFACSVSLRNSSRFGGGNTLTNHRTHEVKVEVCAF